MAVTSLINDARSVPGTPTGRVLAATISCLGRWGLGKTTLDDIAREAAVSRATVYRLFPGGKDTVVREAVMAEVAAFEAGLGLALAGASTLEDLLVAALTHATTAFREHDALQYLLAHEPDQILPHLAFARLERVLVVGGAVGAPWLAPYVGPDAAARAAEWITRVVLSYALAPSAFFDLGDAADARRFARTFLLPGLVPAPERGNHHG